MDSGQSQYNFSPAKKFLHLWADTKHDQHNIGEFDEIQPTQFVPPELTELLLAFISITNKKEDWMNSHYWTKQSQTLDSCNKNNSISVISEHCYSADIKYSPWDECKGCLIQYYCQTFAGIWLTYSNHVRVLLDYISKVPILEACCLCQVRVFFCRSKTVAIDPNICGMDSVILNLSPWI